MEKTEKILVAGAKGLVGSALVRKLRAQGYENLLIPSRDELELLDQQAVRDYFGREKPDYVFLAAAIVGGIHANSTYPADFIYQNLMIQNTVIDQCFRHQIKRLLFLGSSCIYPRLCPQPMKEEYFMTGPLEPTNEPYAIAKIAGIEMCWAFNRQYGTRFLPVMPTNLYGPNDNFNLENSHVLPALLRKFHDAKAAGKETMVVWGSGQPRREFLHVDDMADACLFLMNHGFDDRFFRASPLLNIGTGQDVSIMDLAMRMKEIVGFRGQIVFDPSQPDGMPRKLSDSSRLKALGWQAQIDLETGIRQTYDWFLHHKQKRV